MGDEEVTEKDFLVVQWLRIRLPMQETWVLSLVRERRSHMPGQLSPCAATRGPTRRKGDPVQPKNKVGVRNQWWDFSGRANYPDSSQGVPPAADAALRSQVDGMTWEGRKGFLVDVQGSFPPSQGLLTQSTFTWLWCLLWKRHMFWRWIFLPWPSCFCQRQHCGLCRGFIYCLVQDYS